MKLRINDKTTLVALALIVLVGLAPLTWYRPGYTVIRGDDSPYWFNSLKTFLGDMNVWSDTDGLGHVSKYPYLATLFAPMYILQTLSITNSVIQVMLNTALLIISGLAMFYFLTTLIGKKPGPILVGTMFYMFAVIFLVNIISFVIIWAHAFLPHILTLFIKLLRKRVSGQPSGKLLLCFAVCFSVFMSFLADSPPILIIGLTSLLVVFVYLLLTEGFRCVIRQSFIPIGAAIIASLWWIIPFALTTLQVISAPGLSLLSNGNLTDFNDRGSFLNWFWFMPAWKWQSIYYPFVESYYTNPIVIIATFVPIILVAVGIFFKQKDKVMQYLFLGVILIGMFIGKGTHQPFPQLFDFLSNHIPMFDLLFREPENKLGVMVALFASVPIACSMDSLINAIKRVSHLKGKRASKIAPALLIALASSSIIISAGPMFMGTVVDTETERVPFPSYVKVPDYWSQAGQFFDNDSTDFRVLITPDSPYTYMGYTWGYWGADSVPLRFIQKPVLYNNYGYQLNAAGEALNLTYQTLQDRNYTILNSLLSALNVKYILIRNDLAVNFSLIPATPLSVIHNSLGNDTDLEFIQSFGLLDIYENKNWEPTHFVASTTVLDGNTTTLLTKFAPEKSSEVQVTSTKVSASEYKVYINATQPFYLFFSESYDSGWKVTQANAEWYSIPFGSDLGTNHTAGFRFGNEWYINKVGSYEVTVTYAPESYFLYVIVLTLIGFAILGVYLGLHFYVKSHKKASVV